MAVTQKIEPKSPHLSDNILQPFLQPTFDPAAYLNGTLPPLSTTPTTLRNQNNTAAPLNELSAQTQTLLSQLNAQTTRLSTTLTQLTDDIIRSGSRLAYEVDLLKGEATSLTDALKTNLHHDIQLLAPGPSNQTPQNTSTTKTTTDITATQNAPEQQQPDPQQSNSQPTHLHRLTTLTTARRNLQEVIHLFGIATSWPLSPAEQSSTSNSIITISPPTHESETEKRARETKATEFKNRVREEITELVGQRDLARAKERVGELRVLLGVWEGTGEEKVRRGFVEGLGRVVEETEGKGDSVAEGQGAEKVGGPSEAAAGQSGYGFMRGLRKLGDGVYLD